MLNKGKSRMTTLKPNFMGTGSRCQHSHIKEAHTVKNEDNMQVNDRPSAARLEDHCYMPIKLDAKTTAGRLRLEKSTIEDRGDGH